MTDPSQSSTIPAFLRNTRADASEPVRNKTRWRQREQRAEQRRLLTFPAAFILSLNPISVVGIGNPSNLNPSISLFNCRHP
jgi:hypothetical protein